jgi:CYTH domain-containing protein
MKKKTNPSSHPAVAEVPIFRIVLTGGPCGGKSSAQSLITDRLEGLGFDVYRVPEAATLLFSGGVNVGDPDPPPVIEVQRSILRTMLALEDNFASVARSTGRPSVILCDRGTMDASAYMQPDAWDALLNEYGFTTVGLRDARYDAVIHMVTAADGAEDFYSLESNRTRTESAVEARRLDDAVRDAWIGHAHLRVIDNSTGFENKVMRVLTAACEVVGIPEPMEVERKFLIAASPAAAAIPVKFEEFEIEQTYLASEKKGWEARVRRRGQSGSFVYTHTMKRPIGAGTAERIELERKIPGSDYIAFLAQADPDLRPVYKRRRVFLWENTYFEWDTFEAPRSGLQILEVEVGDLKSPLKLPPFIEIEREVTGEAEFLNRTIAGSPAS